jgi:HlyD family secretion protein
LSAQARVAGALARERQARAQITGGEASSLHAKGEAARSRALFETGAGTREQLDRALLVERMASTDLDSLRFAARVAEYEVAMARAALRRIAAPASSGNPEELEVPAPVAGTVLRLLKESEGVVQAGTPLLEVGDPTALEVVIDVLTTDAVQIAPGAEVRIERWGGPPFEGRVRRIEPAAFTKLSALGVEEQRVNVLVDVVAPRERWASLGDGFRVEARIVVWEGSNLVKLPTSAIFRHAGGWAAFRVHDGRARLTPVEIGQRSAREVQIKSGLDAGSRVVVHPSDRVADGSKVAER